MSVSPKVEVQVEVKIHTRSTHMQYKPTQLRAPRTELNYTIRLPLNAPPLALNTSQIPFRSQSGEQHHSGRVCLIFYSSKALFIQKRNYKIIKHGLFVQKCINIKGICVQKDTIVLNIYYIRGKVVFKGLFGCVF